MKCLPHPCPCEGVLVVRTVLRGQSSMSLVVICILSGNAMELLDVQGMSSLGATHRLQMIRRSQIIVICYNNILSYTFTEDSNQPEPVLCAVS